MFVWKDELKNRTWILYKRKCRHATFYFFSQRTDRTDAEPCNMPENMMLMVHPNNRMPYLIKKDNATKKVQEEVMMHEDPDYW